MEMNGRKISAQAKWHFLQMEKRNKLFLKLQKQTERESRKKER